MQKRRVVSEHLLERRKKVKSDKYLRNAMQGHRVESEHYGGKKSSYLQRCDPNTKEMEKLRGETVLRDCGASCDPKSLSSKNLPLLDKVGDRASWDSRYGCDSSSVGVVDRDGLVLVAEVANDARGEHVEGSAE